MVKSLPVRQEAWIQSLGREDPLKKEMATYDNHYSILAWGIPWIEEPGGLHSTGLQRIGHDWAINTCNNTLIESNELLYFLEEGSC